jgi:hypothetical protein
MRSMCEMKNFLTHGLKQYHLALGRLRPQDSEFEASLG